MQLKDKYAIVYGGAGAVGSAVARAFAREGATVFLAGRTLAGVEAVARDIGGTAEAAEVDALDERAIEKHLNSIIGEVGRIDISFNAVGIRNTKLQGVALSDLDADQFSLPIATYTKAYFLTSRLAARPDQAEVRCHHDGHVQSFPGGHPDDGRGRSCDERCGGSHSRIVG